VQRLRLMAFAAGPIGILIYIEIGCFVVDYA
jgi:hypothetical protein